MATIHCCLLVQDTEWFENKRQKRGRNGARRDGERNGNNGSLEASSSRGVLSSSTDYVPAAAAVGSFCGGTFTSGVYQALEDLEGGLEEEGNAGPPLLSPSAVAAAVPMNPVLEELGELEPEEEQQDKGGGCTQRNRAYATSVAGEGSSQLLTAVLVVTSLACVLMTHRCRSRAAPTLLCT